MNLLILGLVDGNLLQDDSGFIASPTPGDHFYIIWYFLLGFVYNTVIQVYIPVPMLKPQFSVCYSYTAEA